MTNIILGLLLLPSLLGLFMLWHIFRPQQKPADTSNRINKIRLLWFALTREYLFTNTMPWLKRDELDNLSSQTYRLVPVDPSWVSIDGMNEQEFAAYIQGSSECLDAVERALTEPLEQVRQGVSAEPWQRVKQKILNLRTLHEQCAYVDHHVLQILDNLFLVFDPREEELTLLGFEKSLKAAQDFRDKHKHKHTTSSSSFSNED